MRFIAVVLSILSLSVCLLTPLLVFYGALDVAAYKQWFLLGTLGWFVFGTLAGRKQAP